MLLFGDRLAGGGGDRAKSLRPANRSLRPGERLIVMVQVRCLTQGADLMRIGVFSNTYKPIISGVVTSILLFRRGLEQRGHEVIIFAPDCRGHEDDEEGVFRYPAIDLPESLNASLTIPFSPRISRLLPMLGLDIIHSHHPVVMGREAVRVARRLQVPLVFTCHSRYEDYSVYVPLADLADPLVRKAIRNLVTDYVNDCDLAICPSQHVKRLLEEYGVNRPVDVIPTPVLLDRFSRGDGTWVRRKHGLGDDEPVLAFVGRLALEKGLPFLLQAFSQVLVDEPACTLLLVGSGPKERLLREQVDELGIRERVVFAGFVEHEQVPDYLAGADLFLFSSTSEVQPLSVLEALAAGLPVVAVRSPATEEMLTPGRNGELTERCESAFAAEVVGLLRDEDRRLRYAAQAKHTAESYSVEALSEKLERAYDRLRGSSQAA